MLNPKQIELMQKEIQRLINLDPAQWEQEDFDSMYFLFGVFMSKLLKDDK